MERQKNPHAIMIALPYQGHITPFINLSIKLASKNFSITFVHLEFIHHKLSQNNTKTKDDLFSEARESGLDIRYTTISDGFPLEFDRDLHLDEYWDAMLRDFPARVDEFVGEVIKSDPNSVHFLVTDTLFTWPATIAKKYDLINVSFWTEPALVFSLSYHIHFLKENGHFPCKDNIEEVINYLPGVESLSTMDLMPYLKESGLSTIVHKIVLKAFDEVKKSDFILHNTLYEFESKTLSALTKIQPNYAIGPINFSRHITNTVTKSLRSESDCTNWLNSKSPGSVLYISFGSFIQTSKHVIEEIAYGLLLSDVNFIWIVREDSVNSDDSDVFPDGFRDEINEKGLVITWCDQIKILSSPAIGGFLTHCGWNSVLESMWCGVPMICYPLKYDQPVNRKLVVDDWKIGVNLCDGKLIDRKEVAEKIGSLMSGVNSEGLRKESKKVQGILQNAMEVGGSFEKNFNQFVEDLKAKL
ncbi:hypothetical protein RD792_011963 [Penstemon davidsonii]|uniref:Glycosyltransferase n=1 Tax=Penstemon davidsonii TaxID=160366 RepID=A0ABR0CVI8_9LAMI|nr:hypothetical protein RD792_011963 [Penstemon davidsonii]